MENALDSAHPRSQAKHRSNGKLYSVHGPTLVTAQPSYVFSSKVRATA